MKLISASGSRSALFKGSSLSQIHTVPLHDSHPSTCCPATRSPCIWQLDVPHCLIKLYHWLQTEHLPLNNELRKPVVKKMRRDHINSSIEQLKTLLAPEFLNQQLNSKLEKADILEMTVSFLR
ncbi:hypothetical protein MHYP_G00272410 [Metynnis hypsauchen]